MSTEIEPFKQTTIDQWLDSLITEIRRILLEWAKDTFLRYRKCGQLVLESGYKKGRWQSEQRHYFLKTLGISQQTFSNMVRLGEMSGDKFTNAISNFSSLDAWANQKSLAKKAKRQREIAVLKEAVKVLEPPKQRYDVIVVDPPWPYGTSYDPDDRRIASPYPEMSIEKIKDLKLPATENCILWLWTTNAFLHDAFHILEAWGFEPKTLLTWVKTKIGIGVWLRGQTEHCILAVRGQPLIDLTNQSTVLFTDTSQHSKKPGEFYNLVESLCIGWKLNYFAREKREGWDTYGTHEIT